MGEFPKECGGGGVLGGVGQGRVEQVGCGVAVPGARQYGLGEEFGAVSPGGAQATEDRPEVEAELGQVVVAVGEVDGSGAGRWSGGGPKGC